jgi:phytoene dehydrogenase-like protein
VHDVAIVGGGISGLATALRLQAAGLSTLVLEAHGQPGGCAGFFREQGFSFDVGATTLVDFEPGGVGAELLSSVGMEPVAGEALPGYVAWLPDRRVTLHRDPVAWARERARVFPGTAPFWEQLDRIATVFWAASRAGIKLPIQSARDLVRAARALGASNWSLARHVRRTLGDALRSFGLRENAPLVGLLGMLVEDTVHATVDGAPLVNAALGITIRGAGLTRARGGMRGFLEALVAHYRALGGELRVGSAVTAIEGSDGRFVVTTRRGRHEAAQVVAALPAALVARLAPEPVSRASRPSSRETRGRRVAPSSSSLECPRARSRGKPSPTTSSSRATSSPWARGTTCSCRSRRRATPRALPRERGPS